MLISAVRSRAVSLPLQPVPYSVERAGTKREWGKTRLTPHRPKPSLQYVIVEIDTDDGITGVGEACTDIGFFGEPVEEVQSAIDLEARSDLHRRQSVQLAPFAAAPQQVRLPAAHLAGARSTQREVDAAPFHEPVHDVEQRRHLLHLVDHDEAGTVPALLLNQKFRCLQIAPVRRWQQQVDPRHIGKLGGEQGTLALRPRPPQKKGPRRIRPQLK